VPLRLLVRVMNFVKLDGPASQRGQQGFVIDEWPEEVGSFFIVIDGMAGSGLKNMPCRDLALLVLAWYA